MSGIDGIAKTAKTEVPIGFNLGVLPVPVLDLHKATLAGANGDELLDIVARFYFPIRPRAWVFRKEPVIETEVYDLNRACYETSRTPTHVYSLVRDGKLHSEHETSTELHNRKHRFMGYEIIRLGLKPHFSSAPDIAFFAEKFYISEAVAQALKDKGVIKTREHPQKGIVLLPHESTDFFDKVHPIYGTPRYYQLGGLPQVP